MASTVLFFCDAFFSLNMSLRSSPAGVCDFIFQSVFIFPVTLQESTFGLSLCNSLTGDPLSFSLSSSYLLLYILHYNLLYVKDHSPLRHPHMCTHLVQGFWRQIQNHGAHMQVV